MSSIRDAMIQARDALVEVEECWLAPPISTQEAIDALNTALYDLEAATLIGQAEDDRPSSTRNYLGKGPIVVKHFMREDPLHYATVHSYGPLILCDCHSKTPPYGKIKPSLDEALFEERGGRRAVHYGRLSRQGYQPREDDLDSPSDEGLHCEVCGAGGLTRFADFCWGCGHIVCVPCCEQNDIAGDHELSAHFKGY